MKSKILTILLFTFVSFSSYSQSSQTYPYNGEAQVLSELTGRKTHTEYRQEQRESTCYRDVFSHYENVCRDIPMQECHTETRQSCHTVSGSCRTYQGACRTHCHTVNGREICKNVCPPAQRICEPDKRVCSPTSERVCHTTYRQECESVARYKSEAYSCIKTVSIPYEVFDYDIKANVQIDFTERGKNLKLNEELKVSLVNEDIVLSLSQNNQTMIAGILSKDKEESISNGVKEINFFIEVEIYNIDDIKNDLDGIIKSVDYVDQKVKMVLKKSTIVKLKNIDFTLTRDNLLFGKKVHLKNKEISNDHLVFKEEGDEVHIDFDLEKYFNKFKKRKYEFSFNFNFGIGEKLITKSKDLKLTIKKDFIKKF